jgi:hypothetical protein
MYNKISLLKLRPASYTQATHRKKDVGMRWEKKKRGQTTSSKVRLTDMTEA